MECLPVRKRVYVLTIKVARDHYGSFQLMKNSDILGTIFLHSASGYSQMTGGNAVVSLDAGDIVFIRTHSNTDEYAMHGDIYSNDYGMQYFSGWLLSQL